MKKHLLIALLALFVSGISFAQLSGTKTIGPSSDYPSIEAAIADLNSAGVGAGGVTFNVASGHTETFSSPIAGRITTTTSSLANPVVFQKTGTNPVITAGVGTSTTLDGIIVIAGSDYITFDGIDLKENTANLTATTQMEWGYAMLKASAADGSQSITIKNCTITLNKANTASVGIYANNHTKDAITALTGVTSSNSNLKIFSNTISNCYTGIAITGFNDVVANSFAYYDQNNEIGKDGANTITSFGGSTVAKYGIFTKYQNNLKVANNLINGTVDGSGACSGIYLDLSYNANLDLYSNAIKIVYNGTGAFNGIYDYMGNSYAGAPLATNVVNIYDNSVTQCTYPNATTSDARYFNISHAGASLNFHNNYATNNVYGSATASANGNVLYFYFFGNATVLGTIDIYNNDASGNSRSQSATPGGGPTTLYSFGLKGSTMNVYNNTATNNTCASSGQTLGYSVGGASPTRNFYGNTLSGIYGAKGVILGVQGTGSGTSSTSIYGNKIEDLNTNLITHATLPIVSGMYFTPSGNGITPVYIYNNMVSGLKAPLATSDRSTVGVYISQGNVNTYYGIYDNTVYLDGTGASGFGSSALFANLTSTNTFPTIDLRGNIFVNNCTPVGTGNAIALRTTAIGSSCFSGLSNNNNYYAGTPDPTHLIYYEVTNSDQTLAAFKTRVSPRESFSVTENPPFVNVASLPYNLHLNAAVATQCESAGQVISIPAIVTDFDGNNRYPNAGYPVGGFSPNNPDIGADEFGGLSVDYTQPMIQFTPLTNAPDGSARQLIATIQDASGIPVAGDGLPVLYWKINSGVWQAAQGVHGTGSDYTFTFGAGSLFNDVVSYFIVAQDNITPTANVGSNPIAGAAGFTTTPPACATAPISPYTYINIGAISGTFHIGVGKTYSTINSAVNDLNSKNRTGPITFLLDDATYPSESFPIIITSSNGASAINTVTLKPNTGMNVEILGENIHPVGGGAEGLIQFNGAQYIIIDGYNGGSSAKSLNNNQNLTIENIANASNSATLAFSNNGSTPAAQISVQNCILHAVTTTGYATTVISFSGSGGGFNDIVINNNIISQGKFGIALYGVPASLVTNVQITNNLIGSETDLKGITWRGVDIQYCDNLLVEGNEVIGQPSGSVLDNSAGIGAFYCSNTKIRKNKIHDWFVTGPGGSCIGLSFSDYTSSQSEITNNLIYNIKTAGSNLSPTQACAKGIIIDRCQHLLFAYNTVYLSGAVLGDGNGSGAETGTTSTCVHFSGNATGVDFRNNILNNSMTRDPLAVSPNTTTYAVSCGAPMNPFTGGYSDNNDYFGSGFNPQVGYGSATVFATLTDWKTYTLKDVSSVVLDPLLTSTTNLLPLSASPIAGAAVPLATVTTDVLEITRNLVAPTIGAYELPVQTITFNVDMSTAAGFVPGTDMVYLAGNFPFANWSIPGTNSNMLMTQVGTSLIYTKTLGLTAATYEYKYFKNAGWGGGEYAGGDDRSITVTTTATQNDIWGGAINWANLQWPVSGSITEGGSYDVYAQAYIQNGVTAAAGATTGLQAWIGYSSTDTDPNTWTNWVAAPFFGPSGSNDEFKAEIGTAISSSGTYYYASRFQYGETGAFVYGGYSVSGGGFWNGTTNLSGILTVTSATKTLNLNVFLEGLYVGAGVMHKAQDENGDKFTGTIADQVTIELHNGTAPFDVAYSFNNVDLNTDGTLSIPTVSANASGSYYIVIKHRNSIETWSAAPVAFSSSNISYDFSISSSQAFGDNQKPLSGGLFAIFGGDVSQDGIVDGTDMASVDNASTAITLGYVAEDANADGVVDGSDMALIDNNSTAVVSVVKP